MFSLVLFHSAHKLIHLLCLILKILHMNIFRGKKNMNLPDVTDFSVILTEFWFSALEGRKEKKITKIKCWIWYLLIIVLGGKWT